MGKDHGLDTDNTQRHTEKHKTPMTPRGEGRRAEIATEVTTSSGAEDQPPVPKMEHQRTTQEATILATASSERRNDNSGV